MKQTTLVVHVWTEPLSRPGLIKMSALNRRHLHVSYCGASREAHDFQNVQHLDSRGGVSNMVFAGM